MVGRLGPLTTRLFAWAQLRGRELVSADEIVAPLKLTPTQARRLLRRLDASGLIARVRPKMYLIPPKLPLGNRWSPTAGQALAALLASYEGRYQICGPSAFNLYGWSTQVAQVTYAYNDRISGERAIGPVRLRLIKVESSRLGGVERVDEPTGTSTVYSSRTRSLIDAIRDWSRFNSLPLAYEWARAEIESDRVQAGELVDCAIRFGDIATRRRIGVLLERMGVADEFLKRLSASLSRTSGKIAWIPSRPMHGHKNGRWGVVENESA
jgi:predicted transcriptional regulator of viral defense system